MRMLLTVVLSVCSLGMNGQDLPSDSIPEDTLYAVILDQYRYPKVDFKDLYRTPRYYDELLRWIKKEKDIEFYARFYSPTIVSLKSPRTGEINTYDFKDSTEASCIVVPREECLRRLMNYYGSDTLALYNQRYHIGDSIYLRRDNYMISAIEAAGFKDFSKYKRDGKFIDVFQENSWLNYNAYTKAIFTGFVTMPAYDAEPIKIKRDKFGSRYGYYATFAASEDDVPAIYQKYIGDTLYVPVEKAEFLSFAITPSEHKHIMDSIQRANDEEVEVWNMLMRATYNNAKDKWGKRIADLIHQGKVEFGFTPEMVIEAKHLQTGQAYNIYRERTPLGYATVYEFFDGDKFYFINKKLIGVKWYGKPTKYRKR